MSVVLPPIYVPKTELYNKFTVDCEKYKIIHICAHTGWGKTIAVLGWLKESKYSYDYIKAENQDKLIQKLMKLTISEQEKPHIIIIDDFHRINNPVIRDELVDYISSTPMCCHFILSGRTAVSAEFKPYVITRQLRSYGIEDFRFTYDDCQEFFECSDVTLSEKELNAVYETSKGYPLSLSAMARYLKSRDGKTFEEIVKLSLNDIFDYYDISMFNTWTTDIQNFLIHIAGFDEITLLLAQMVTLSSDSNLILDKCCSLGSFMIFSTPDKYTIHPFYKKYLMHKQDKLLDRDELILINRLAGNYYEMIGNHTAEAVKYYHAAEDYEKVKLLLVEDASHGVGLGNFIELEPYYLSLSEGNILQSPLLCSAVSMLHSINCRIKESEYYFTKLLEMRKFISKKSDNYRILEEQIAYLSIALPHTGNNGLVKILANIAKQFAKNGFHMQEIAITGNMPSLMHGGKDFCEWSKSALPLRNMLKGFVEFIFITDGIGLADTGVGEAFYEQGKLDAALVELTKGTTDSRNRGSVEMLFAGTAVLARLLIAKGEYEAAVCMMDGMKEIIIDKGKNHLLPNFNSFMVLLQLLAGETGSAEKWLENEAPDENLHFYTTERYRYMIKVKMYIIRGNYTQAEILLVRLRKYFREYSRTFDYMEATLLEAIIYFRTDDERWQEKLNEVLLQAQKYNFIRIFADEGTAVYPLLAKMKKDKIIQVNPTYFDKIITATHKHTVLYPDYLKSNAQKKISLTNTEQIVLTLLARGKKYREIEEIMEVSENTIKFHIKNIYSKLKVKGKNEAIASAKKLNII